MKCIWCAFATCPLKISRRQSFAAVQRSGQSIYCGSNWHRQGLNMSKLMDSPVPISINATIQFLLQISPHFVWLFCLCQSARKGYKVSLLQLESQLFVSVIWHLIHNGSDGIWHHISLYIPLVVYSTRINGTSTTSHVSFQAPGDLCKECSYHRYLWNKAVSHLWKVQVLMTSKTTEGSQGHLKVI